MKHKTWFRLVVKAIGILLFCLGLAEFCGLALLLAGAVFTDSVQSVGLRDLLYQFGYGFGRSVGGMVIGAFLLSSADVITDRVIPSNRPYCPACGYEIAGVTASDCPECGVTLPREPINVESGRNANND